MMNEIVRYVLEQSVAYAQASAVLEEGLVRYDRPGHTRQLAQLPYCHEGRYSAGYYAFGMLTERLEEAAGLEMLEALARLQITVPSHPQYGGFLWYREETEIQDSNAAFFTLMPLVTVRLCYPDVFPEEHAAVIDGMLHHAAAWFSHECRRPEIYYPNKIMSDGAMLLAVASLTGQQGYIEEGVRFFERWDSYTERRGWGWGENMSLTYQGVMLNALRIAVKAMGADYGGLASRLNARMEELKSILRFHAGEEFVPTIRSYNFQGETARKSLLWAAAGVSDSAGLRGEVYSLNDLVSLLLLEPELDQGIAACPAPPVPRVRAERIFDRAAAYTWIGHHTRLGSVNKFPVIPGCYQWPTWGLGWQSFPVSFSVKDHQVSYLRWYVHDGEMVRTHPNGDYHKGYLKPALFKETVYPDVETRSAQSEHALLVVRSMTRVRNEAAELADEWIIHRFAGMVEEVRTEGGARLWQVLRFPYAAVAVTALRGLAAGQELRSQGTVTVVQESGNLRLRQVLWAPEDSEAGGTAMLDCYRLEAGWAVVMLDQVLSPAALEAELGRYSISDGEEQDYEVPRKQPGAMPRRSRLRLDGQTLVELYVDPYDTLA